MKRWDLALIVVVFLLSYASLVVASLDAGRELMNSYTIEFAELGQRATAQEFRRSIVAQGEMYAPLGELLIRYDALICPSMARAFWPAEGYETLDALIEDAMTWPFNILSRCNRSGLAC